MKVKDLELEIYTKNEVNRICKAELINLYPQLLEFVGKKIFTQTGRSAKFNPVFLKTEPKPFENGFASSQGCGLHDQYKNLELYIKICFNGGKYEDHTYYCRYVEKSIWLGNTDGFVLNSLESLENIIRLNGLDNNIDLDQELIKIDKYKELKAELDIVLNGIKVNHDNLKYL